MNSIKFSGVGLMLLGSDPELIPILIGIFFSLQASTINLTWLMLLIFPGFNLILSTP